MPRFYVAPAMIVGVIALAAIVVNSQLYRYAGRPEEVSGVVGYIDEDAQQLIVIVSEHDETKWKAVDVLEETMIIYVDSETGENDVIGLDEIGPGDDVKLILREQEGKYFARHIWVTPGQPGRESSW